MTHERQDPLSPRAERFLREELPSRVAHALRGPLGVMTGVLAELRSAGGLGGEGLALLDLAERSGRRIERIGERLSLLARLERGDPIERRRCDLAAVAAEAIGLVTTTRQRRRVEIVETLPSATVEGDPALLRLAVAEVVDNAVRFARSRVYAVIPAGAPHQPGTGREVEIRVRHDGHAYEGDASVLFESYVPHPDKSGLGIGLFMASEIVRLHDGRIGLQTDAEGQWIALWLPSSVAGTPP